MGKNYLVNFLGADSCSRAASLRFFPYIQGGTDAHDHAEVGEIISGTGALIRDSQERMITGTNSERGDS
jgi:hypothetical protein